MNVENLTVSQCGAQPQAPRSLAETLTSFWKRAVQRNQLATFDELLLRDLGVSETDVWRETNKAPWQA
ncbi:MAG TPA: DUF1127 domain-containing protein [Polyangiales bacterium]|nr:DUF1127 domain-containing protein [Polyangiales bacterium]